MMNSNINNNPGATTGILLILALACCLLVACLGPESKNPSAAVALTGEQETICARDTDPESFGMPKMERIYGWVEDIVALSRPETGYRRTGTKGAALAAAYIKCRFEALGLKDVHYETVTSWSWQVRNWSMNLNEQSIDVFPSAHSFVTPQKPSNFSTGPEGLNAEIVDIGSGTPIEIASAGVKGKIVVFDLKFLLPTLGMIPFVEFLYDPNQTIIDDTILIANPYLTNFSSVVQQLMDSGAVGFVGILADYFDSKNYYNEFYRRTEVTIPGFWVSPKEGARLRSLIRTSSQPMAKLVLEGSRTEVVARSVVGCLPGKSKDAIMVQSHHDSVFYGAVEDASGTASVLAQAQYFASQPAESREKTLMFATFDTHFSGYQGHVEFVRKYIKDKETPYTIIANITLEHIAKQGVSKNGGRLEVQDQPELRGIMHTLGFDLKETLKNSIISHDLRRTALLPAHVLCNIGGIPTDASFVCTAGVPTVSLIAGPNYLYDLADTLDKVDKDQLVPVANVFAELIEAIDTTPSNRIGIAGHDKGKSQDLSTRWPIILSHAWSNTSESSFLGEKLDRFDKFDPYGVKKALEEDGAVVFQPDKLAYASHEDRGQLLYKKCKGRSIKEVLCQGKNPEVIDGIHKASIEYCAKPAWRARSGFSDEASCRKGLKFNIICHSQGCPDSRYMMAAVHNEFSGELISKHVASWTSLAGANKGTSLADYTLEKLLKCDRDHAPTSKKVKQCKADILDFLFGVASFNKNKNLIVNGSESVIALTTKYMLVTTDMNCTPGPDKYCAPSFNQLYPLPNPKDLPHPVLYQTFSTKISDFSHPCYKKLSGLGEIVQRYEGENDGYISVVSQRYTTDGPDSTGRITPVPVIARWISGTTNDTSSPHPGLDHMSFSSSKVPGMPGVSCSDEDNNAYHFSRIEFFKSIATELVSMGF